MWHDFLTRDPHDISHEDALFLRAMGPFLEKPSNLTGPKSYFEIKVSRKVGCVLTSNEVNFVSLADNFTVQFSNLLTLPSGAYRELRETGPRSHVITRKTPSFLSPEPYVSLYPKRSEHRTRGIEQFASYVWRKTRMENSEGLEFGCC